MSRQPAAEFLERLPSEEEVRRELGDTLKRASALRELLKVVKRLPQKRETIRQLGAGR